MTMIWYQCLSIGTLCQLLEWLQVCILIAVILSMVQRIFCDCKYECVPVKEQSVTD